MGLSTAAPPRSGSESLHAGGRPFSLGYGAILPSSLTTVPPIASVCSTRPPVSVLVRAAGRCLGVFLGSMGSPASPKRLRLASRPSRGGGFPCPPAYALSRGRPEPRPATLLRRPVGRSASSRYGNVDPLRIGYASRPRLSSRLTLGGLAFPRKPWAYGGGVSRPPLATHASILAPERSTEGRPLRFAPDRDAPLPLIISPPLRHRA